MSDVEIPHDGVDIHITRGLVSVLLDYAQDHDPSTVSIGLMVTKGGELTGETESLGREDPVFTHFYMPDAGESVNAVFGIDLSIPRTQGRFVSHPDGHPELSLTDDLHEIVFVAIPPWTESEITAYDRSATPLVVSVIDAEPPAESESLL